MDDTLNADEDQPENGSLEHQVAELRAAEEERQAVALASQIVDHLDQLQKDAGVELEQHDLAQIFDAATAQGVGRQQTEAAFKAHVDRLKAIEERAVARYLESKKGSQQVPTGTPAQATPDLKDPEARQRRFAAILEGSN